MSIAFADLRPDFEQILGDIVYATMTTVDRQHRPRSRVLIAVWEVVDDAPLGWLATFPTPVKVEHLAANPHATFSYWSAAQNAVAIDTVATWVDDAAVNRRVWRLYEQGSPAGVGYPPGRFWRSPEHPSFGVLRLEPYRVQVLRAQDLAAGRPSRIWTPEPDALGRHPVSDRQ
ncbi:pyridoxamine 5'-phosphate oxidase family protein [Jiangella aurantiaca]|uniref:Pyridoxamine 5'-phosphate oxidase family protein n=1 Tax=Jiangella aurantiaca TaxID=2530373 RepID=A0A4R5A499_9ACTN|nr:pyridoxamine 5'-phosphate oxidase family protein [Jiangella aurantiaca]TDD65880.1 pyridoxamine 5'-phosphate oxidase family protein [Jiangella aurantiaca]